MRAEPVSNSLSNSSLSVPLTSHLGYIFRALYLSCSGWWSSPIPQSTCTHRSPLTTGLPPLHPVGRGRQMFCDVCLLGEDLESEMAGSFPLHVCRICNREFHENRGYRGGGSHQASRKGCPKCSSDSAMFIESRTGDTLRYRCPHRRCGHVEDVVSDAP